MTPRTERRELDRIAAELLADETFAKLVAIFTGQPVPVRRRHPALIGLTVATVGVVAGFLAAAAATGVPAFLVGFVLIVPAFWLFGRACDCACERDRRQDRL